MVPAFISLSQITLRAQSSSSLCLLTEISFSLTSLQVQIWAPFSKLFCKQLKEHGWADLKPSRHTSLVGSFPGRLKPQGSQRG